MIRIGYIIVIFFFTMPACAHGKSFSLFTAKAAEEIKAADKITGVEKVADKAKAEATGQIGQTNTTEKTEAGRDVNRSTFNDSVVMERYIGLMKYFLWTIGAIAAAIITALCALIGALIAGLVYCLKYMLKTDRIQEIISFREKNK